MGDDGGDARCQPLGQSAVVSGPSLWEEVLLERCSEISSDVPRWSASSKTMTGDAKEITGLLQEPLAARPRHHATVVTTIIYMIPIS